MELDAAEHIRAPLPEVWAWVTDFPRFEALARRRATDLQRIPPGPAGEGTRWEGEAEILRKRRKLVVTVASLTPETRMTCIARVDGLKAVIEIELTALEPERTRLSVVAKLGAETLAARLLLQPLKLAQEHLTERLRDRLYEVAGRIEGAGTA